MSAVFAVASLPVIALLLARLGGRLHALIATVIVAASWTFLFHGVYGRMYSLFLFTSALSYLALLHALERGGRKAWALWALAILATVATHPYGALVLASQGVFVAVAHRDRLRAALWAFGAVAVLGIPFWLTDLVLAGRFDAGVGGGGSARLDVVSYVWDAAGDFTAGFPVLAGRAGGGRGRARRPPARDAGADGVCSARPARGSRDRTQLRLTRDPASDLPAPFRRAACRGGNRAARARLGAGSPRGARRRAGRLGVGQDARALQLGAGGAAGGPRRRGRVPRRDDATRTTSCSATTRSSSRPGSATATSRS